MRLKGLVASPGIAIGKVSVLSFPARTSPAFLSFSASAPASDTLASTGTLRKSVFLSKLTLPIAIPGEATNPFKRIERNQIRAEKKVTNLRRVFF